MADAQVIREWLKKADEDFDFAVSVIEESTFYAQICFHFHQAAEKYLKSVVIGWDLEFKKIHDLPVLLKSVLAKEASLQTLLDDCKLLNRFYIDTRYPVHWPTEYTKEEIRKSLKEAKKLIALVKEKVK